VAEEKDKKERVKPLGKSAGKQGGESISILARDYVEPEMVIDEFFLKENTVDAEKIAVRKHLGMNVSVNAKKKKKKDTYTYLKTRFYKAGIEADPHKFIRATFYITLALLAVSLFALGAYLLSLGSSLITIIGFAVAWWIVGFILFYFIVLMSANAFLNYKAFKRRLEVEKVLPEYLRLVATNYRSGLPLHKALIASNRPRFGVFSREIEMVAKISKVKGNFSKALEIFGKKFDSKVMERAMSSISISVRSGSSVSSLLEDIADNITKMRSMRMRLAASVKNYVIFIVVAGIIIAPLMFSMSYHLNMTIGDIKDRLDDQGGGTPTGAQQSFITSVGGDGGVIPSDFDIFATLMILTNSVVSGLVIGMIKYGNFHQGMRNIPVFMVTSIILYNLGKLALGGVLVIV